MNTRRKVPKLESVLRWSLTLFLSVCFAAFSVTSIAKYRDKSTGLSIGERSQNYFKFPTIVVCSQVNGLVSFHNHRPWINMVWSWHRLANSDNETLGPWQEKGFQMTRQNKTFQEYKDDYYSDSGEFREFYLPATDGHHYCNSFDHPTSAWNSFGLTNAVMLNLDMTSLRGETPFFLVTTLYPGTMNLYDALLGAIFIPAVTPETLANNTRRHSVISMEFAEKNSLPMKQDGETCLDEKTFSAQLQEHGKLVDCTEKYFMTEVPCYQKIVERSTTEDYPCDWEEQDRLGEVADELLEIGKTKYLHSVGCQLPCNQSIYTLRLEASYEAFDWFGAMASPNSVNVLVFAQSGTFTIVTEYLIFDLPAFAAAVGGMMGMLLGASFLTLFDAIAFVFKRLLGGC